MDKNSGLICLLLVLILAVCAKHATGECVGEETGLTYQTGESYSLEDDCGLATCTEEGFWYKRMCLEDVTPPPPSETETCEFVEEDESKAYPECCAAYICTNRQPVEEEEEEE